MIARGRIGGNRRGTTGATTGECNPVLRFSLLSFAALLLLLLFQSFQFSSTKNRLVPYRSNVQNAFFPTFSSVWPDVAAPFGRYRSLSELNNMAFVSK
jgi:hypothetical protein